MRIKSYYKQLLLFIIVMFLGQNCISTATMSDLSNTASIYDFEMLSKSEYLDNEKDWSDRTMFEYYLKSNIVNDSVLLQAITGSLEAFDYKIKIKDLKERAIVGQRGLKGNEWKSVVGVYYRTTNISNEIM